MPTAGEVAILVGSVLGAGALLFYSWTSEDPDKKDTIIDKVADAVKDGLGVVKDAIIKPFQNHHHGDTIFVPTTTKDQMHIWFGDKDDPNPPTKWTWGGSVIREGTTTKPITNNNSATNNNSGASPVISAPHNNPIKNTSPTVTNGTTKGEIRMFGSVVKTPNKRGGVKGINLFGKNY